ncbi:hypothetical protein DH2020_013108 [Rehmannia glutinosa]|uniref:Uncharacterized protein n=1 Tax=Rehmannia glutinosa TaxID=99300 RepID=A0ABR0X4R0_REHGL
MDVWIVAAAAGAGYVAQRLKNLNRGKHKCFDLSSENLNIITPESSITRTKVEDTSCPFRRLLRRKNLGDETSKGREKAETARDSACVAETASTSGYEDENLLMQDNFASFSIVPNSSSLAGFLNNEDVRESYEGISPSEIDEDLPNPSSSERGFSYGYRRNRSSIRSRRINSRFIKPQTSLESCLMAQLYDDHAEIEEYTYYADRLQKPNVRPFVVSDGSRIISTTPHENLSEPIGTGKRELQKNTYPRESKTVVGVPSLRNVVSVELRKKAKARNRKERVLRRVGSSKVADGNQNNAEGGSERALLFYLGITMGIISSFLANKQEMEKLNKLLKQTENLVQDLQEELEMKDSLTVKELEMEDYESQDVHNDCHFDDPVHALAVENNRNEESCDQKAEEESISIIEAELEAELERLESNMKSSRLEGKLSNLTELDPYTVSDVLAGKLRSDLFGANTSNQPYADRYANGSSTARSVNYSVSPRELSLRLHEVIQSRLEERVNELEMALQNSQRKVKYLESSEHMHPWTELSDNNTETPIARDGQQSSVDQPVIINLSGEALVSYNEAYDEFTKVSESDEEDLQFGFENDDWFQNGHVGQHSNDNSKTAFDRQTEENFVNLSNDITCSSRDESEDGEDEMEKLLIRQIVEKAKQGGDGGWCGNGSKRGGTMEVEAVDVDGTIESMFFSYWARNGGLNLLNVPMVQASIVHGGSLDEDNL